MGVPSPRDAIGHGRSIEERLAIQEARPGIPARLSGSGGGTTSERDIYFTVPTDTAAQVALANSGARWFNQDRGWQEAYYVPRGSVGLTTRGLIVGAPAGWYPVGSGPRMRLFSAGGQPHAGATEFSNWKPLAPASDATENDSYRFGSQLTLVDARVVPSLWGKFRVRGSMSVNGGTDLNVLGLANYREGVPVVNMQKPVQLISGYGQIVDFAMDDQFLRAGDGVCMRTVAGTWTIGGGFTYLSVEYIAPPLATDA